jgi:hypothetical protein
MFVDLKASSPLCCLYIFDLIAVNPGHSVLFVDIMCLNFMSVNLNDSGTFICLHVFNLSVVNPS